MNRNDHNRRRQKRRLLTASTSLLILLLIFCSSASAQEWDGDATVEFDEAQEQETPPQDERRPAAEQRRSSEAERAAPRQTARERQREVRDATRRQLNSEARTVHIYQLVEEMIDEIISDVAQLNVRAFSPVAFRNMNLTPNLSAQFGEFVESTLISALVTHTDVNVRRCVACNSLRSRVDEDDWVVSMGLVHHEDLVAEAARIGANSFLDARLSYFPGANIVAMQVEIFRAEDGAVLWTETYRSDATTAAILRTGDRVESRAERVAELERRIDARPYYGHTLTAGATYIPYDSPRGGLSGASIGYRLYERFGPELRYYFGIGAEGFANFSDDAILGSFIYATLQMQLSQPNLNSPIYRTGPAVGGFFAGTEGNSFFAEWGIDAVLQFRLGAGASIFYFLPTEFAGYDLGGFGLRGRVTFNW